MIRYLDCVYRVSEHGEMIAGEFDIDEGVIVGEENLMHLDVNKFYDYYVDSYRYYSNIPKSKLYALLSRNPSALAVINYNNIGAIVVFRDKHSLYVFKTKQFIKHTAFLHNQFDIKTEVVGVVKTPLHTCETMQPLFYLVVDKSGDVPIVHTRFGKKRFNIECDVVDKPSLSRFLEMCNNDDVYASIERNGKVLFTYIDGNEFKVVGGNENGY